MLCYTVTVAPSICLNTTCTKHIFHLNPLWFVNINKVLVLFVEITEVMCCIALINCL